RAHFLFPLLRLVTAAGALVRRLLFLVALLMLALGLQPPIFLFPVIQRRSRKSDIEISNSEIIRARIVFFRPQCFLESFDRVGSDRLDREKRSGRWGTRGFCPILLEKRESGVDTHDTGHTRPAFSVCTEGRQPNDLARCVEQRAAGTAWVNVDIRHDRMEFDLADDEGAADLIEAGRAAWRHSAAGCLQ